MPKPNKQAKRPTDVNQWARQMVEESTHQDEAPPPEPAPTMPVNAPPTAAQISAYMAEIGRRGGKIGGKRRLETMTDTKRSAIARKAAQARWLKTTTIG